MTHPDETLKLAAAIARADGWFSYHNIRRLVEEGSPAALRYVRLATVALADSPMEEAERIERARLGKEVVE